MATGLPKQKGTPRRAARWMPTGAPVDAALRALRTSDGGLLTLALAVGGCTGLAAVGFRWLVVAVTRVLTGHDDYAGLGRVGHGWLPALGPWFVVATPVVAGLVYGPLVAWGAPEARGHGVPEVMFAVARRGGRIAPRVAAVKALASALCIGGGGSVGREGPIVQIGSALASTVGGAARVPEDRLRVLVACGAAGGIAATFNAPLAGVVFALEVVLRDFAARSFGMVVIAAVTSSVVGRSLLGDEAFLSLPQFTVPHLTTYLLFALLGLVAGAVGVVFTRVLYGVEDLCDRVWRGPEWLRPAIGGLLLGLLLLAVPATYGVGYPVLDAAVAGRYAVGALLLLLVAKMVATSLTMGIGGSGGVFAPCLFLGAVLGDAYGQVWHAVAPGATGAPGAFALVGMGAVFAGAARAPITAVLIVFELTGDYGLILPLMAAVVLATGLAHLLSRQSIYTAKLSRRGVDLDAAEPDWAHRTPVHTVAEPASAVLAWDAAPQAAEAVLRTGPEAVPVVASDGGYLGVLTRHALADALARDAEVPLSELVEARPSVDRAASVAEALDLLDRHDLDVVPVVDAAGQVLGVFTSRGVLAALRRPVDPQVPGGTRRG